MIKAVLFDLDGTLVRTEEFKSRSYYQAVWQMSRAIVAYKEVEAAYMAVIGRPRQEVAAHMVERFNLDGPNRVGGDDRDQGPAREVLMQLYVDVYENMLSDADLVRSSIWPNTLALLKEVRAKECLTALVSMAPVKQVQQILTACQLSESFDLVLTREKVRRPKPDPEVYLLAARLFGLLNTECLVVEDTTIGVQSALGAGMYCVALASPLTRQSLFAFHQIPHEWIIDDSRELVSTVEKLFKFQVIT